MNIGWQFPLSNFSERVGLNQQGIVAFGGQIMRSLAREICQNSLDAGQKNKTVKVEFHKFEMDSNELLGKDILNSTFQKCIKSWSNQKNTKTKDFFTKAKDLLNNSTISMLRISDFNTKGLLGSDKERDSDWMNLVKASGSSDKNESAGGSFGIGKYATFTCSEMRTVFYNTLDINGLSAFQGVSRLVSFTQEDGQETQGIGYYGETEKNLPINHMISLDKDFNRNTPGTDVYITAFNSVEDWKKDIIVAVLDSFLVAIYREQLEIVVDEITINKETLSAIIREYSEYLKANYVEAYYEILVSEKTKWIIENFKNLGNIRLGLLIKPEGAHRKVAMVRKTGMKILDRGNISGTTPFAGVLIVEGDKLNDYLRKLENERHDNWEADRYNPAASKMILKELRDFIIDKLNSIIELSSSEELDVDGVGELLPDEIQNNETGDELEKDILNDKIANAVIFNNKKPKVKDSINASEEDDGKIESMVDGVGGIEEGDNAQAFIKHGTDTPTSGDGDEELVGLIGDGDTVGKVLKTVKGKSIRVFCVNKNEQRYKLIFTPDCDAENGSIQLNMLAEQSEKSPMPIVEAICNNKPMLCRNGKIIGFDFKYNETVVIEFKIDYEGYCSLEVKVYGY